ncbi:hypothetical protein EIP91_003143 [Steccherinum ochraceum]|uniref:Protein HGH1 homolog n=1 Tax=Steccherinum ochraceum TaxID=92696 RepID=A0A4R0RS83_9APHY|nr:hypothetical protein EIP91_003143 [Steccherinum ochraceum]
MAEMKELLQFLRDKNPAVRQIALENLLPCTPKESPNRHIFFDGLSSGGLQGATDNDAVRSLKLLCRDQLAVAHDAFRALVNLSDNGMLVTSLSENVFLTFLVSYILNPQSTLADLASMLLSNMTASATVCAALLSLNISVIPDEKSSSYYAVDSRSGTCMPPHPYPSGEPKPVLALPLLIEAFSKTTVPEGSEKAQPVRKGDLHFLSSVFANISATPAGRMFFVTPRPANPLQTDGPLEYPLSKLLAFTEHPDLIRRGGIASTLKNCAFQVHAHKALLSPESDMVAVPPSTVEAPGMDILPYVLLPLAGPEEFDLEDQELLPEALQFLPATKTREADQSLRLMHVETMLLLCTTYWGREYLRAHGVYQIVRALHEDEKVEKVAEHIERLVNFLKRNEGPDTKDDDASTIAAAVAGPAGAQPQEEDDDEDMRIEEI